MSGGTGVSFVKAFWNCWFYSDSALSRGSNTLLLLHRNSEMHACIVFFVVFDESPEFLHVIDPGEGGGGVLRFGSDGGVPLKPPNLESPVWCFVGEYWFNVFPVCFPQFWLHFSLHLSHLFLQIRWYQAILFLLIPTLFHETLYAAGHPW